MSALVKRSRDDVIAYLSSFGLPPDALESLRGSFDLWHEKRVAIETQRDEALQTLEDTNGWLKRTDREGTAHQTLIESLLKEHGRG